MLQRNNRIAMPQASSKIFVFSFLLLVSALQCIAAPVFEMGTGARAVGLGSAVLAIADDESAVFYNPAGLTQLKETIVAASYHRAFEAINHIAISGAMRGWGFQILQIDSGPLESANEFGNPSGVGTRYESRAGMLGFAVGVEGLALGGRAKVQQSDSEFGWGLDLAGLVRLGGLHVGVVGENLLSHGEFTPGLRAGAALEVRFSQRLGIIVALDAWNLSTRLEPHLGLEVEINDLRVRAGYDGVTFATGAGARWGRLRIDWAYRVHPQLPASTIVTVAYFF